MKTGAVGRADLLDACRAGGPELQATLARLMGWEYIPPEPPIEAPVEVESEPVEVSSLPSPAAPAPAPPVPFWQATTYRLLAPIAVESRAENVAPAPVVAPAEPLEFRPLASAAAVVTKLRRVSSFTRPGSECDVARLVHELSRGRVPGVMPRRSRKAWGQAIHLVVDSHEHLKPYFDDQAAVEELIRRVYPREGVEVFEWLHGRTMPTRRDDSYDATPHAPEPGAVVLALSDLGALAIAGDDLRKAWAAFGAWYRECGARPIALVPCDLSCLPPESTRDWVAIPWEGSAASRSRGLAPEAMEDASRRLLALLSFAIRIEPALIREVRRLLVEGEYGAGLESRVWQDPSLRGQQYEAAEFQPGAAEGFRDRFGEAAPEVRQELIALLRRAHLPDHEILWHLERLGLEREAERLGLPDDDLRAAVRWVQGWESTFEASPETRAPTRDEALWFRRAILRLAPIAFSGSAGDPLHGICRMVRTARDHLPTSLDPARLPDLDKPIRLVELRQAGDSILARPFEPLADPNHIDGSLLGLIRTRNGLIKIDALDEFSPVDPPSWADDCGWDRFGAWATIRVGEVVQRMRWIEPGHFVMGSTPGEEGRFSDESQRREVISEGFWLFDTPCTQALWTAVMGKNPSRFQEAGYPRSTSSHPVEQVSWEDCQEFLRKLNERLPGLSLSLPSESQWEYACREGTTRARYSEDLDAIAWYSENSGKRTHPVATKSANGWGLYDMLGNVYEWCSDVWRDDYREKPSDRMSTHRVIRGGSWNSIAPYVRAAFRSLYRPSDRYDFLGFRCAQFSGPEPASRQVSAERGEEVAEHPGDREPASGAAWIALDAPEKRVAPMHAVRPLRVRTDIEEMALSCVSLPEWASAIGRDVYGLWAEFTIEAAPAKPARKGRSREKKGTRAAQSPPPARVRQRLRWIPPGRFRMGSPLDEQGRWDWEQEPHEVAIDEGFWIFDTPCTQALWEAVTGENPSQFKSPDRPVESVSWDACCKFAKTLSGKLGWTLSLPSEAQWEYACRAGTTTSTYAGQLEIQGARNGPILHEIAWYGGNSGLGFELTNGLDASNWPEKQFKFDRAGSHPVAQKRPNAWGLYDMLGNVWEWCEDRWDGDRAASASALRVLRGGSWYYDARYGRAACRSRYEPSGRSNSLLGFRCAQLRSGREPGRSGAREGSEAEGAEHPGDRDPTSGAGPGAAGRD